jgi:hypothetical protein
VGYVLQLSSQLSDWDHIRFGLPYPRPLTSGQTCPEPWQGLSVFKLTTISSWHPCHRSICSCRCSCAATARRMSAAAHLLLLNWMCCKQRRDSEALADFACS